MQSEKYAGWFFNQHYLCNSNQTVNNYISVHTPRAGTILSIVLHALNRQKIVLQNQELLKSESHE